MDDVTMVRIFDLVQPDTIQSRRSSTSFHLPNLLDVFQGLLQNMSRLRLRYMLYLPA